MTVPHCSICAREAARQQFHLARQALIDTGYFTANEVGDDVAPRIAELWEHVQHARPQLTDADRDLLADALACLVAAAPRRAKEIIDLCVRTGLTVTADLNDWPDEEGSG